MRVLFNNTEITKQIERLDTTNYAMTCTTTDYIYIASDFPFNHLFFKLGTTKNAIASAMTIEYWGSSKWNEVVELRDETNGLFTDGFVEFTPNKNEGWSSEELSSTVGLTTVLYDKFWVRISFSVNLTAAVSLSYLGHKFSDDSDLFAEYPIFNNSDFLTAFQAAKTTWEEQHIKAAEMIALDLTKKSVIIAKEQILERRKFITASVCKVAEIIYTAFGNDYTEQKKAAREAYYQRLDLSQYSIDSNGDGILSPSEVVVKQGWLSR